MSTVYGIPLRDHPRLLERVIDDGNIKVMDPIYLFRSKCHCLLGLDQNFTFRILRLQVLSLSC